MSLTQKILVLIAILAVVCCATLQLNSTPSYFAYLYDAAGNRIERIYVNEHTPKRSVETIPFTGSVVISPNPATDYIKVKISDISKYKESRLAVYDLQGRLLEEKTNVNEETTFNLTQQNNGAYYISVTLDESERKFKIIRVN
ncbi:MAG: T9SS type A sorting domain-containing protein [bacterium]